MKRYAIADYLTDDDRARILAHRYVQRGQKTGESDPDGVELTYHGLIPVSADDQYCPLAYLPDIEQPSSAPNSDKVARALFRRVDEIPHDAECAEERPRLGFCQCHFRLPKRIQAAAAEFINDWDHGRIPPRQLSRALGVRP